MKFSFHFLLFVCFSATAQINLTSDLVICLPMNGNANDFSGNGNNGLVSGATPTVNRFGTANSAYHFDGVDDVIQIQPSASINNIEQKDELTITAWCRVNDWYQSYNVFAILEKYNSTGDDGWGLDLQNPATNGLNCGMHFLANLVTQPGVYTYIGATTTTFNQWDFYAATFSRSSQQFKAYKNGVLLNTVNTGNIQLANTNSVVNIGFSPAGPDEFSHGDIDEVRVYSRALNQQEITALFNQQSECLLPPISATSISGDSETFTSAFEIYPNPAHDQLLVKGISNQTVVLYNAQGQKASVSHEQISDSQLRFDLTELPKGLYLLKVFDFSQHSLTTARIIIK